MYSDGQLFQVSYRDLLNDHSFLVGSMSITTEKKEKSLKQQHQNKPNIEIKLKSVTPITTPSVSMEKETVKMWQNKI